MWGTGSVHICALTIKRSLPQPTQRAGGLPTRHRMNWNSRAFIGGPAVGSLAVVVLVRETDPRDAAARGNPAPRQGHPRMNHRDITGCKGVLPDDRMSRCMSCTFDANDARPTYIQRRPYAGSQRRYFERSRAVPGAPLHSP